MKTYRVEILALTGLAAAMTTISSEGWTLTTIEPHPFDTIAGEVEFITVWEQ